MNIGFIGIGRMGSGMAANLLHAGHQVTVYNRTPEKIAPLVSKGAKPATSIADACGGDFTITMLAEDGAVTGVTCGPDGILANLSPCTPHISCSTISVALSNDLAERHRDMGRIFISAPVFGRPDAAAAQRLIIVAAGDTAAVQAAKPVFDAMGQKTFVVSDQPGDANLIKISGNFLIASVMEALGEAFALVGKAGLDRQQYLSMLTTTLFDAPVYKSYGALIASDNFEPAGFAATLGLKDLRLVLAAAEEMRVPMPLASLLRDRFLALLAHDGGSLDWSAIGRLPAVDAGIR